MANFGQFCFQNLPMLATLLGISSKSRLLGQVIDIIRAAFGQLRSRPVSFRGNLWEVLRAPFHNFRVTWSSCRSRPLQGQGKGSRHHRSNRLWGTEVSVGEASFGRVAAARWRPRRLRTRALRRRLLGPCGAAASCPPLFVMYFLASVPLVLLSFVFPFWGQRGGIPCNPGRGRGT